jgi:hypothetical protein
VQEATYSLPFPAHATLEPMNTALRPTEKTVGLPREVERVYQA